MFPLILVGVSLMTTEWDAAVFGVMIKEISDTFRFDLKFLLTVGSAVGIAGTLVAPVVGYLADRVKRVRMLAWGNVISSGGTMLTGIAPAIPMLAGARVVGGTGDSIASPAGFPLLTDWFPPEKRARVFSFVFVAAALGNLIGSPLVGGLGQLLGWRFAMILLGGLSMAVSMAFFLLKEPVRGALDRAAMGADQEAQLREQEPVSWGEGWRAISSIVTVRRLWYATPFLIASSGGMAILLLYYFAQIFGIPPFYRGVIFAVGQIPGIIALMYSGPATDRLLSYKPGRVFGLLGLLMGVGAAAIVGLVLVHNLVIAVLITIPIGMSTVLVTPALITLVSMVVPPRLRGFGIQAGAPFRILGLLALPLVGGIAGSSVREGLALLVPLYAIGAVLVVSAGAGVERDIRAALAASMADEEVRRSRARGGNKMLVCRDVDVSYEGAQVLFNLDFDLEEGELVALLGTNGAGKSTLLRAISGMQQASNGAIFLDGREITHRPAHENAAAGVVFMPGGRATFPGLTVAENLRAAAWTVRKDEEYVQARTNEVLGFFPVLRERLDQRAGTLSGGEQQMVALGQAFLMRPRLLLVDELSLGLAPAVVEQLLDIIREINAAGTTVVLVEQSINVALTIARRAVFMDKGRILFDGPTGDLLRRRDIVRSVFLAGAGGGGSRPFIASGGGLMRSAAQTERTEALRAEGLAVSFGGRRALNGASVRVARGEIVGIIGPNGAGKTTLFDVISGYVAPDAGQVFVGGIDVSGLPPDARARAGLGRSFQNARLFPSLTVRENIAVALERHLAVKSVVAAAGWLPNARRSEVRAFRRVEYLIDLLSLDAFSNKFVSELSTGTRRMVDIACIMAAEPQALLLDEPSSGLAQSEVEVLGPVVKRLAREGDCGVVVIEHDIPLVTALADRLVAMQLGRVLLDGDPAEVVAHPTVVEAYLGASPATINRSGHVFATAMETLGLSDDADGESSNGETSNGESTNGDSARRRRRERQPRPTR
jgi:branched-chain amino acid transport system ATP-binding protein